MADRLKNKVAIVVGAGSIGPGWGNGKATATLFAREGASVVCADVNLDAAKETADIINGEGGRALAVHADVSRHDDIVAMVKAATDEFGRVDVLDYNVGIAHVAGVVDLAEDDWDRVMDINIKGCYLSMKHVIPVMQANGGGSIINISSVAGIRWTGVRYDTYYASKAAMLQLSKAVARAHAADNIRVNAVLPGLMKTPMVATSAGLAKTYADGDVEAMWEARDAQCPMGHMGDAWDVAYACLFLASDESKYVTGLELVVDGGVTL